MNALHKVRRGIRIVPRLHELGDVIAVQEQVLIRFPNVSQVSAVQQGMCLIVNISSHASSACALAERGVELSVHPDRGVTKSVMELELCYLLRSHLNALGPPTT